VADRFQRELDRRIGRSLEGSATYRFLFKLTNILRNLCKTSLFIIVALATALLLWISAKILWALFLWIRGFF